MTPAEPLRLLILGAHPDDAEYHAGGLVSLYRQLGHVVKMVSLSNGAAGHQTKPAGELAEVRRREAAESAAVIGAASDVWDYADGALQATLELRQRVIREIRGFRPDLVLTHRTNDYHPDHRAAGQVVQDASFLVRVPRIVPEAPVLQRDPVVAFMSDLFTKPSPLAADVVIDVAAQVDTIVAMLACHRSQVFEWLPWLEGILDQVPSDEGQRRTWLRGWYAMQVRRRADRYRRELIAAYGEDRGSRIEFAEMYEISEYGSPLDAAARQRLFGFVRPPGADERMLP
jgi:LmbE family N-acetylglucosaminyl deacetylase